MTRINIGYPVAKLTTKHLIAEHREIKRIPNTIQSGKAKIRDIPNSFRLGTGHVKFFYDKCLYLLNRYKQIHQECLHRGFKVEDYSSAWNGVPKELMNDYEPTREDCKLIEDRIQERLAHWKSIWRFWLRDEAVAWCSGSTIHPLRVHRQQFESVRWHTRVSP